MNSRLLEWSHLVADTTNKKIYMKFQPEVEKTTLTSNSCSKNNFQPHFAITIHDATTKFAEKFFSVTGSYHR